MTRAEFAAGVAGNAAVVAAIPATRTQRHDDVAARAAFAALEARHGGRLGVAACDVASGRRLAHRADEAFPFCSTIKVAIVGAVLARVDRGAERLRRPVPYGRADLLEYAPVTRANVARGAITVAELCAAAIVVSDNTAANLLVRVAGGPAAVTAYLRSLGDARTRLDRMEPNLNTAIAGDPRDTTTPAAMLATLRALTSGAALSHASRDALTGWLDACETGTARLRAGLPHGWRAGDKTGTGAHATRNDIAILRRPNARAPVFVTAYYTASTATPDEGDRVLADVGRIVGAAFA